jgi:hypothetical protein
VLAIVNGPPNVHARGSVDLEAEMRALLDEEDYLNFVAAVARLGRTGGGIIGGIVGGIPGNSSSPPAVRKPNADGRGHR